MDPNDPWTPEVLAELEHWHDWVQQQYEARHPDWIEAEYRRHLTERAARPADRVEQPEPDLDR